jgi:uncharacterized UPF0160 family protein
LRVATHSGSFHADEVFAVAALELAVGDIEVIRTRDADAQAAADLRVDVGFEHDPAAGTFDHHQRGGAGERSNGVRYASFGLIWQAYGERAAGDDPFVARLVDESLVQGVDAQDTGQTIMLPAIENVQQMHLGGLIGGFNPNWDEPGDDVDKRFADAVAFARGIIEREVRYAQSIAAADRIVAEAVAAAEDPRIVVLDQGLPWARAIHAHAPNALFVVLPKSSGWGVQAIPAVRGQFDNRLDLPEAWAGLQEAEFAAACDVEDVVFCHAARFLAVARSQAGALKLAHKAITA